MMAENKILISHPSYPSGVLKNLYVLYLKGDLVDISLEAKHGTVYRLHRCILAAGSKYFNSLFCGQSTSYNYFQLTDVEDDVVKLIIDFLYTGQMHLYADQIEHIYAATKFLQIEFFFEACTDKVLESQPIATVRDDEIQNIQNEESKDNLQTVVDQNFIHNADVMQNVEIVHNPNIVNIPPVKQDLTLQAPQVVHIKNLGYSTQIVPISDVGQPLRTAENLAHHQIIQNSNNVQNAENLSKSENLQKLELVQNLDLVQSSELVHIGGENKEQQQQGEDSSLRRSKRKAALNRRSWASDKQSSPKSRKTEPGLCMGEGMTKINPPTAGITHSQGMTPYTGTTLKLEDIGLNFLHNPALSTINSAVTSLSSATPAASFAMSSTVNNATSLTPNHNSVLPSTTSAGLISNKSEPLASSTFAFSSAPSVSLLTNSATSSVKAPCSSMIAPLTSESTTSLLTMGFANVKPWAKETTPRMSHELASKQPFETASVDIDSRLKAAIDKVDELVAEDNQPKRPHESHVKTDDVDTESEYDYVTDSQNVGIKKTRRLTRNAKNADVDTTHLTSIHEGDKPSITIGLSQKTTTKTNTNSLMTFEVGSSQIKPMEESTEQDITFEESDAKIINITPDPFANTPHTKSPRKNSRGTTKQSDNVKTLTHFNNDKPRHTCTICLLSFFHSSTLKYHIRMNHYKRMGVSPQKVAMYKIRKFVKKCRRFLPKKKLYRCALCRWEAGVYSLFVRHVYTKHNLYKRKCTLQKCRVVCSNIKHLQLHQRKNHRTKFPQKCDSRPCPCCLHTFKFKSNLERHQAVVHPTNSQDLFPSFKCKDCLKAFASYRKLIYHSRVHTNRIRYSDVCEVVIEPDQNFPFRCKLCTDYFRGKSGIVNHARKVHGKVVVDTESKPKRRIFTCNIDTCDRTFGHLKQLTNHVYNKHREVKEKRCDKCDYSTILQSSFDYHVKTKHKPAEQTICDICGFKARKPFMLLKHKWKHHNIQNPSVKVHPCPVEGCDFIAFQKTNLTVHMRSHSDEKPYTCDVCGRKVKTERTLKMHMRKVHLGVRPYICDMCGTSYGEEHELKAHIARHDTTKKYKCEHCSYSTCDKPNFSTHMYSKHRIKAFETSVIYQCDRCDYSTDRKIRLQDHRRKHDDIKAYKCQHCNKEFGTRGTLRTHNKWIHSDVVYNCQYCEHSTKTAYHLKEHMRVVHTHRHVKPFKCSYCPYTSAVSGNCRKHIKKKHKGQEVKWIKVCERYSLNVPASAAAAIKEEEKNAMLKDDSMTVEDVAIVDETGAFVEIQMNKQTIDEIENVVQATHVNNPHTISVNIVPSGSANIVPTTSQNVQTLSQLTDAIVGSNHGNQQATPVGDMTSQSILRQTLLPGDQQFVIPAQQSQRGTTQQIILTGQPQIIEQGLEGAAFSLQNASGQHILHVSDSLFIEGLNNRLDGNAVQIFQNLTESQNITTTYQTQS